MLAHALKDSSVPDQPEQTFIKLPTCVGADLEKVEDVLQLGLRSHLDEAPRIANHLILAGGKRIRPLLMILFARMYGYEGSRHVFLAACVEFIHTATLMHDDVVDNSDLRRGNASTNETFGNPLAVLVGDFLFTRAFQLMVDDGDLGVLKVLSDASAIISEGEINQILISNDLTVSVDSYINVIRSKTATLFAASAEVGAMIAPSPKGTRDVASRFGMNLGIAFQLVDDVLDYSARLQQFGKSVGNDFKEGKVTLPLILAMERVTASERSFLEHALGHGVHQDENFAHTVDILNRCDALEDAMTAARDFAGLAFQSLDDLPDNDCGTTLRSLVQFNLARGY